MREISVLLVIALDVAVGIGATAPAQQPQRVATARSEARAEPRDQPQRVYYRNCAAARAAGAAPLLRGRPGYATHLDRDGDGIACEPYSGRR